MKPEQAVAIWDRLEAKLLSLGLSAEKLLVSRAELIRAIGEVDAGTRRKRVVDALLPVVPAENVASAVRAVRNTVADLGGSIHDQKLAEYLEQACSGKAGGYDGADVVEYYPRRG